MNGSPNDNGQRLRRLSRRASMVAVKLFQHALGTTVVLCVYALCFVNAHVVEAIEFGWRHMDFYRLVTPPLMLEVGLAACVWAIVFITYRYALERYRELRTPNKVFLKRARGTILTETLIVMPIFLLLTSGLAQLSINSTARVLMAVATFQAGRTAWLWEPETRPSNPRNGMAGDQAGVEERARIAAATVLTPVAPAEFRADCDYSQLFDDRMRAFGVAGAFAGVGGASVVRGLINAQKTSIHRNMTYVEGFDTSIFAMRGAKKFYVAYCLTDATYTIEDEQVRTTVNYDHLNVFPWFAYIVGERKVVAGTVGWFTEFENSYGIRPQIDVNPRVARSIMASIEALIGDFF